MNKAKILILVEGEKTDIKIMKRLLRIFGIEKNHDIVSYKTNIYVLYNEIFKDGNPDDFDLLNLLKSREFDLEKKKIFDDQYSDVILVFDFDPQDHLFSIEKIGTDAFLF